MDFLINIGSLLFVFFAIGFCIFIHELGHFLAAKWRGMHIDAFAIGFKPFWRKKINGVEYRLGMLPFGGYVEIPQVDATDEIPKAADGTLLPRAKPIDRIITGFAGPFFNILSGLLIGCVVWFYGLPQDTPKMREITVYRINQAGPEYQAGLRENDKITRLNNKSFFCTWSEFVKDILFSIGDVELTVERDGKTQKVTYRPVDNPNAPGRLGSEKIAWPYFIPIIPIEIYPEKGSIAEKAGIKSGDIIIAIDDEPISEYYDYQSRLNYATGREVKLTVRRGNETLHFNVRPEPIANLGEDMSNYVIGLTLTKNLGQANIHVMKISKDYPGELAGIRANDIVTAIDGQKIDTVPDFIKTVQASAGKPVKLTVLRGAETLEFTVSAQKIVPQTIGADITLFDHPSPVEQFVSTMDMTYKSLRGILVRLGHRLGMTDKDSSLKPSHMSGPLGMGLVLFNMVKHSIVTGIHFMVIISFALAIFNLFPLPVLDGGHIMFGVIEIIFGKPMPAKLIKVVSIVFVSLLISLMVYVTFFDMKRLYRQVVPDEGANHATSTQKP